MTYLYGLSVQGIQGFIFETNRLKDIVGASNLIEKFTSEDFLQNFLVGIENESIDILRNAGGNIRISFREDQKELAQKFVKDFPKYIMSKAYGITISQAVEFYKKDDYLKASKTLELALKNVRNRVAYPLDTKFSLVKKTSRTGKPASKIETYSGKVEDNEELDMGTYQKFNEAIPAHKNLILNKIGIDENDYGKFPFMLEKIKNTKNKIAVIHADGNKMGILLQKIGDKLLKEKASVIQNVYKEFSIAIVKATNNAVSEAFSNHFTIGDYDNRNNQVPFRPIVIGGDDVTVICHADKAIDFIRDYMQYFQENTTKELASLVKTYALDDFSEGLTACAGIAYCNEKFPFHYAVDVAEALCGRAKEASGREASCLLFHNIQGSAFINFEQYVANELTIRSTSLVYGPYYIEKKDDKNIREEDNRQPRLKHLQDAYKTLTSENFPTAKLREWLNRLHDSDELAQNYLDRLSFVAKNDSQIDTGKINKTLDDLGNLSLTKFIDFGKTPIHDILQLKSVQGGK